MSSEKPSIVSALLQIIIDHFLLYVLLSLYIEPRAYKLK